MSFRLAESTWSLASAPLVTRMAVAAQDGPAWTPEQARSVARDIMSGRRFRGIDPPTPLKGLFARIGDRLHDVLRRIGDAVDSIGAGFPGGPLAFWIFAGAIVVLLTVFVASRAVRRGGRLGFAGAMRDEEPESEDPRELERLADEAERSGRLERAIRLRFRAGLLRLDAAGAIEWRPSLTTGEVSARLRSGVFDEVARIFDEVVYGRRVAKEQDLQQTRSGWSNLGGAL